MSKDSSFTYVHMHHPHHADLFEDFCRPPSGPSVHTEKPKDTNAPTNTLNPDSSQAHLPGHFLPFDSIDLPPHLQPLNPEDEDDVVPDMHAAFGINRALGQGAASGNGSGQRREPLWRDLGLEEELRRRDRQEQANGVSNTRRGGTGASEGVRRVVLSLR